jgi:hypothetical protein
MTTHSFAHPRTTSVPGKDDVMHLVGPVDDDVVTAILATGAGYGDIASAVNCMAGDPARATRRRQMLSRQAAEVYEILASDPMFADDLSDRRP